jgi:hypothetical protein
MFGNTNFTLTPGAFSKTNNNNSNVLSNTTHSLNFSNPLSNQSSVLQTVSRDNKKFLPGRPSLHDILSVAPQWKEAFETLCKTLALRDGQIRQIQNVTQDLEEKNKAQKDLINERVKKACTDLIAQDSLFSEIEAQQPIVRKWRRQVHALSTAFHRTLGTDKVTPQPLIVPQSDYLRFIDEIHTRFVKLEKKSLSIEQATDLIHKELQGEGPTIQTALKNILTGFMNQYRLLKYAYLLVFDELKSVIERYKYSHPQHTTIEQQLEESLKEEGSVYMAMLTCQSKPYDSRYKLTV